MAKTPKMTKAQSKAIVFMALEQAKKTHNAELHEKSLEAYDTYIQSMVDEIEVIDKSTTSSIKRRNNFVKSKTEDLEALDDLQASLDNYYSGTLEESQKEPGTWVRVYQVPEVLKRKNAEGVETEEYTGNFLQEREIIGDAKSKKMWDTQKGIYEKQLTDAMDRISGNKAKKIVSWDDKIKVIDTEIENAYEKRKSPSKKIKTFMDEYRQYSLVQTDAQKEKLDKIIEKETAKPPAQQNFNPNSLPTDQVPANPQASINNQIQQTNQPVAPQPPVKTLDNSTTGTFNNMPVKKNSKGVWYQDTPGQPDHQSLIPKAKYGEIKDLAMLGGDMNMNQSIVQNQVDQPIKNQFQNPGGDNLKKFDMKKVLDFYDLNIT